MTKTNFISGEKGQMLVPILAILVILGIMLPLFVIWVEREAVWTVKEQKSVTAFNLAEAGLERGLWTIKISTSNWTQIKNGTPLDGYHFDSVYDDIIGGQYRIRITSGPLENEITIVSEGRTIQPPENRALKAIYARKAFDNAISVDGAMQWKPGLIVHWGPVVSYSAITQAPADWYPRKVSKGRIVGRDTNPDPLNSDNVEYWAYEDLGSPPVIDVDYYINVASFSRISVDTGTGEILKKVGAAKAVANPPGSGIFLAAANSGGIRIKRQGGVGNKYDFRSSTSVIYTDGTLSVDSDVFLQLLALVGMGNVNFDAQGVNFTAYVPPGAELEYVKKKQVTPAYVYPGEATGSYVIGSQSPSIRPCGMRGFLYCGGQLGNAGNSSILGSVYVKDDITMNNFTVFYDTGVAYGVQLSETPMEIKSWQEVKTTW
ncbi:MAG: hypothetical protein CVU77_05510 [Elusimicrobia bacterium HGW-Elusimicrobia-1]|jgi:hypothetical protein|nr:MAG: hypothetical protein CVU77_05510 [Elusimicrobia bacterium HGW-Elusimicrobia-1]